MLQLLNRTAFPARIFVAPDPDGIETLYAIVKATFTIGPAVLPASEQLPIVLEETFSGEPAWSSLSAASDIALLKPGTDVVMTGTAYPPGGKAAEKALVSLAVGPVRKTVIVFGDRVWEESGLGAKPTRPKPFESMPLVWERAYGGIDRIEADPPVLHAEPRNPVGRGFKIKEGVRPVHGLKLPNLEHPKQAITSWKDRPEPVNFAPICAHWEPRRSFAGTYDAAWKETRAPYLPADFDPAFFQVAPPGQTAPGYLTGGEDVEILGASPSGPLRFRLPRYAIVVDVRADGARRRCDAHLDTVTLEPDAARLSLVWRSAFRCDKKTLRVREVALAAEAA